MNSRRLRVSLCSSSVPGNCFGTCTFSLQTLPKEVGVCAAPCTSFFQWHLSASIGNVIDMCHHLERPPCLSRETKTRSRDRSPAGLELIEDPGFKEVPHAMLDPKHRETLCARPQWFYGGSGGSRSRSEAENLRQLMLCDTLAIDTCRSQRMSQRYPWLSAALLACVLHGTSHCPPRWIAFATHPTSHHVFLSQDQNVVLVGSHNSDSVFF